MQTFAEDYRFFQKQKRWSILLYISRIDHCCWKNCL